VGALQLSGDETVLDLGCGTGRDTESLFDLLPTGRVVAVDGSRRMLEGLEQRLAGRLDRVDVVHADLREPLDLFRTVDAVMSVATIHWIPDHARLFSNLASVLRPGGQLVVEGGGQGNIAAVRRALTQLGVEQGGSNWNFCNVDETVSDLEGAGFVDVSVDLRPDPIHLEPREQLEAFLATVVLGPDLRALPPEERRPFVRAVADLLPDAIIDYVRLEISAVRGAGPS
jgi:trans-aconitate 2-methyltransferase